MDQVVQLPRAFPPESRDRWYEPHLHSSAYGPPERYSVPIDTKRIFAALRRRWWIVLIFAVAGAGSAWYVVRHRPRVYSATAVIQLTDSRTSLTADPDKGDQRQSSGQDAMLSEMEIAQSRAVAGAVVDSEPLLLRLDLVGIPRSLIENVQLDPALRTARIPLAFTDVGVRVADAREVVPYGRPVHATGLEFTVLRRPPERAGDVVVVTRERAIDRVLLRLSTFPRKGTNLMELGYSAADPVTARTVVNRVAEEYQATDTRIAQEQAHRRRVFIEQQLQRNEAELAAADRALSDFRNRQLAYSSQEKFKAQETGLAQLDIRRQDLAASRQLTARLLAGLQTGTAADRRDALRMIAASPELGQNLVIADLYRQMVTYERARAELTSGPTGEADAHPQVVRFDSLVADTQRQIVAAVQAQLSVLDSEIRSVDERRAQTAAGLQQAPGAEVQENRLQQDADSKRQQNADLRVKYQNAQIEEAAQTGQVAIVDLASAAVSAPSPVTRVTLFGLILGIFAGAALALLLDIVDRTVKERNDIEGPFQLPVLATIPLIAPPGAPRVRRRMPPWRAAKRHGGPEIEQRRSVALATMLQSRSPSAEAFRQLRTSLAYRPGDPLRRILVTSPTEGDGKTSVAVNLAVSLAQQRQRVLLVDCDLYGAKLHRIFREPASPGFCEVVLGDITPAEAFRETSVPGLTVMMSGGAPETTRDVLGTDRTATLISELSRMFDVVILDCSPILALADSVTLSASADAVLLVVRAGHTDTEATSEAVRHLSTVGARLAGAVLNDPEERTRTAGSYYYYGYQYGRR